MKTLLLSCAAFLAASTCLLAQEPTPVPTVGPRFLLLAGTATVNDHDERLIFKIDTVTGETWKYVVLPLRPGDMSTVAEGWTRLEEDASETWMKLHEAAPQKPTPRKPPTR